VTSADGSAPRLGRGPAPSDRPGGHRAGATTRKYAWRSALVLAVAGSGLWTGTHGIAGVTWSDVGAALAGVAPMHLVVLAAIWLGGLAVYARVLAAALPGLGVRRSLLLNLSGSAVANVIPLGGAVATGLNWKMARAWGHTTPAFVAYCTLTNALDVLTKLLLPVVGVGALIVASVHVPPTLWAVSGTCLAVVLVALLVCLALLGDARRTGPARRAIARLRVTRDVAGRVGSLVRSRWPRLVTGSTGYVVLQVVLLAVSLSSVGLAAPATTVLMAAGIERLGTLVPITPGGTGVAELGTIAWLITTGLDPAKVVAGVILYRVFLVVMEIPVGGALLGGWLWLRRAPAGPAAGALV
jgi:putative heme transporter